MKKCPRQEGAVDQTPDRREGSFAVKAPVVPHPPCWTDAPSLPTRMVVRWAKAVQGVDSAGPGRFQDRLGRTDAGGALTRQRDTPCSVISSMSLACGSTHDPAPISKASPSRLN